MNDEKSYTKRESKYIKKSNVIKKGNINQDLVDRMTADVKSQAEKLIELRKLFEKERT